MAIAIDSCLLSHLAAVLVMLGEPACGKSPLGRSVLMAPCRFNHKKFNVAEEPRIRCSLEIEFLRGEAGTVIMGDFLDDPCTQSLGLKALMSLLDVGLYEACPGPAEGLCSGPRTNHALWPPMPMKLVWTKANPSCPS